MKGRGATASMKKLAETGTEWVCIAFGANMKTFDTPEIRWGDSNPKMVTDEEIRHAIDLANQDGMKVILKPVVNPDDNVWRAEIKFSKPAADDDSATPLDKEKPSDKEKNSASAKTSPSEAS